MLIRWCESSSHMGSQVANRLTLLLLQKPFTIRSIFFHRRDSSSKTVDILQWIRPCISSQYRCSSSSRILFPGPFSFSITLLLHLHRHSLTLSTALYSGCPMVCKHILFQFKETGRLLMTPYDLLHPLQSNSYKYFTC